ncbi:MAG: hypothetical protein NTV61_04600 [Candidatus Bathyarchaeota archaeon]|nr:hypothetical protein [Candidatus Bathyarchaeota archaeon]
MTNKKAHKIEDKKIQIKEKRAGAVYDLSGNLVVSGLLSQDIEDKISRGELILAVTF